MSSRSPFQPKLFYYLNPNKYKVLWVFEKQLPVIKKKKEIEKDCLKPEVYLYYPFCCS